MARFVQKIGRFDIKYSAASRNYIVINRDNNQHGHIKRLSKKAVTAIRLINKGIMPYSVYFKEMSQRLLSPDDFNNMILHDKPKYRNINKGVRG